MPTPAPERRPPAPLRPRARRLPSPLAALSLADRRQPKQAVAATVGLEPAGLARCLRGKREPVASGARVYLPVFLSSALEQPVLLDGASWSCTRPSQRCGATTMQSMQTVQSMQFLAQEAKPRSRAAVRSRMRRSRYNEHDAGSKRPGRLCGARMLNPTRTPHERAQEGGQSKESSARHWLDASTTGWALRSMFANRGGRWRRTTDAMHVLWKTANV